MPPMFTTVLAERLARATGLTRVRVGTARGLEPGTIYVAPEIVI